MNSARLLERRVKAARPVLRRLLKTLGPWGVVPLVVDLVIAERTRLMGKNPDAALNDLEAEEALTCSLLELLETFSSERLRRRRKKK